MFVLQAMFALGVVLFLFGAFVLYCAVAGKWMEHQGVGHMGFPGTQGGKWIGKPDATGTCSGVINGIPFTLGPGLEQLPPDSDYIVMFDATPVAGEPPSHERGDMGEPATPKGT